ncbi:MAG: potassium/proton antiporter [Rhodocyclaceae bacterium]|nr:potassium/proton antiporter [Rhodocyclaceae bacterium]
MDQTNTLLLMLGVLLLAGVLASTLSARLGLPMLLIFLIVGMLAGEDGPGGIQFNDFSASYFVGNLALAIILLDGGLSTRISTFRVALWPAVALASWGVIGTAALLGAFCTWLLGVDWRYGLLMGSIVGSTDAAAVFNLLRHSGVNLSERVGATLELESGANDPMAILLVTVLVGILSGTQAATAESFVLQLVLQFGIGAAVGVAAGRVLAELLRRIRLAEGMYPLLIVSGGLAVFGATNALGGSGFLAIFLVGIIVGNRRSRATSHVLRVMDSFAWLAQASLFLLLGLLVTPSHLINHVYEATLIALFLTFVARPLIVAVTLRPFRFAWNEIGYISWVGLRGAVPVVLAVFPVMAGIEGSKLLFDVTFVVVLFSLLVQGATVPWSARRLGVEMPRRVEPLESKEVWIGRETVLSLVAFRVDERSLAVDVVPADLTDARGRPIRCAALVRGGRPLLSPSATPLKVGDEIWLLGSPEQVDDLAPLFGEQAQSGHLSVRNFYGEFVIDADSSAAALDATYGLGLSEAEVAGTTGELLAARLRRRAVVGDRVGIGSMELTVRSIKGNRIASVGLKMSQRS